MMFLKNIFERKKSQNVKEEDFESVNFRQYDNVFDKGLGDGPLLKECGTVVLLNWCDNSTIDAIYPNYFYHKYTITDPKRLHMDFIEKGLLEPPSIQKQYQLMKVDELKESLRENGLKVSGNKSVLIDRLIEHGIAPLISDKYVLSEDGKAFLEEKRPWLDFHRFESFNISAREFKEEWDKQGLNATCNSIAWKILSKKLDEAAKAKQFTRYRLLMSDVFSYFQRNEMTSDAVRSAIVICCLDLSGLNDHVDSRYFVPYLFLSPYYIQFISKHIEFYDPSAIEEIYNGLQLKHGAMNINSMRYYIELAIDDLYKANIELSKLNEQARNKSLDSFRR